MMKRYTILIINILLFAQSLIAQQVGEWHSYLACYNTAAVAEASNNVFALADGTLYSYGKDDQRVTIYSKQTGLSDSQIKLMDYHLETKTLLLVYSNGNIDLMDADGVYNLPFLMNTTDITDKEVTGICFYGEKAYLCTHFGVMVIQMRRKEIAETYKLNEATYSVCIRGETIYAATENGLLKASIRDNLLDTHNWQKVTLTNAEFEPKDIRGMSLFQNMVCLSVEGTGVFYMDEGESVKSLIKSTSIKGMKLQADRLILFTASRMYVYDTLTNYESANFGTINDIAALTADGSYWLATGEGGLVGVKRKEANQFEPFVADIQIAGPKRNLAAFMTMHNGKLWIVGGGRSRTTRYYNPGTLMTYQNGEWFNYDEKVVVKQAGYGINDYMTVVVDPDDETHFYVGTCGEGVLEYKNNEYVQLYNHLNSALQTIFPNNSDANRYVRVQGMCYDKHKNLWMTNSEVPNGIVVRTADGQWTSLFFPGITNSYIIDQITITSNGYKWVNVPHSSTSTGVLVFDDRETPSDGSDDVYNFFSSFKSGAGTLIEAGAYYCVVEDMNGEIWIGTDKGPIYCSAPNRAIENPDNLYFNRILRTNENDENYYFLNGEQVRAIAVDGGNRKWLGTSGSGIFLVSPDGQETIHQFTTANSPLYSNNIQSIVIDHQTGEVFIGTDKGLISYRGEAITPSESYSDVYAFPNPVHPAQDNQVIITGLMGDSNVKITDLNGHLIYQGKSAGGQMSWNCRTANGQIVASGIYLVLASTPGAKESVVTKIAVIK
ncbi:MAG: T9SS type A sorting domain-containing protein [Tannerella sp.]|jgi:ligand-binding sensor domain-containing protein|nr:T9SS type A sorting domain-containing protein [Tannerella sp.]